MVIEKNLNKDEGFSATYSLDEQNLSRFVRDFYALEISNVCSLEIGYLEPSVNTTGKLARVVTIHARPTFIEMLQIFLGQGMLFEHWDNYRVDDVLVVNAH